MSTQTHTTDEQATGPSRSRRGRRVLAVVAAVAVAVVAVALAASVNVSNISIVTGWFPVLLFWVTVAVCVTAVVLRRDVLKEFAIGVPIGIVFVVLLFVGLHLTQAIPAGAPRSMYVWLCVACLVAGLIAAGWHRAHRTRRIAGVVAVVLAVVSAGSAANQAFAYYPTFARPFGQNAGHFMDNAQFTSMRRDAARSGKLPDHGATLEVPIPAKNVRFKPRPAYVWVPPAWFGRNAPKLPVIVLMHGAPGKPSDWTRASYVDATALAFAEQHHGVAPILVMPDINGSLHADSECVNSGSYGQAETYLTQTVPAFMRKNFNAETTQGSIATAGLSEGGMCATALALTHSKEISVFANYSGDESPTYWSLSPQQTVGVLFGGSVASYNAHNAPYLLTHYRYAGMSGWFEAGAQDAKGLQAVRALQPLAAKAGLDACITTPPGGHNFDFWTRAFRDSLPWLSWKLKLTPQPQSVPAQCSAAKS